MGHLRPRQQLNPFMIGKRAAFSEQNAHAFGGIDHAAAADTDQNIGAFVSGKCRRLIDDINAGILRDVTVDANAFCPQAGGNFIQQPGPDDALVGDNNGAGAAQGMHFGFHFLAGRTDAENDFCRPKVDK